MTTQHDDVVLRRYVTTITNVTLKIATGVLLTSTIDGNTPNKIGRSKTSSNRSDYNTLFART